MLEFYAKTAFEDIPSRILKTDFFYIYLELNVLIGSVLIFYYFGITQYLVDFVA